MHSRAVVLILISLLAPSVTVVAATEPLPDVVVEEVVVHPAEDALQRQGAVTVHLSNPGDAAATRFRLQVWAGHDRGYRSLHDGHHDLPAGATLQVDIEWDTLGEIGPVRVVALAGGVRETDYGNNEGRTYTHVLVDGPASADALNIRAGFPLLVAFSAAWTTYDKNGVGAGALLWTWPSDADARAGLTPDRTVFAEASTFGTHGGTRATAEGTPEDGAHANATAPLLTGTYRASAAASGDGATAEACALGLFVPSVCIP